MKIILAILVVLCFTINCGGEENYWCERCKSECYMLGASVFSHNALDCYCQTADGKRYYQSLRQLPDKPKPQPVYLGDFGSGEY